jgi:type IV pilus assembly protein PilX
VNGHCRSRLRQGQRGVALVIALIMLLVLTLLAMTGMNTATTELIMSGNEQYRRNASQAAAAGIEQAIARLADASTARSAVPSTIPPTDRYTTITRFQGDETGLPQSSADKFVGLHYTIESTGSSARDASDTQLQGVMVVTATGATGEASLTRLGTGLP